MLTALDGNHDKNKNEIDNSEDSSDIEYMPFIDFKPLELKLDDYTHPIDVPITKSVSGTIYRESEEVYSKSKVNFHNKRSSFDEFDDYYEAKDENHRDKN